MQTHAAQQMASHHAGQSVDAENRVADRPTKCGRWHGNRRRCPVGRWRAVSRHASSAAGSADLLSDQLNGKYLAVKRFGIYAATLLVRTGISRHGELNMGNASDPINVMDEAHRAAITAMTPTHSDTSTRQK